MTADIITEYAFAKSYDYLDSPDFRETYHEALITIYTTGNFGLHVPLLFPLLNSLPEWLVIKMQPVLFPITTFQRVHTQFLHSACFVKQPLTFVLQDTEQQVVDIRNGINEGHKNVIHPTIFHELINSNLPPQEKSNARLGDEARLVVAAGLVTTAFALTVASFHIINFLEIFHKLRKELEAAIPDLKASLD
jgi:hypothetical protein